MASLVYLKNCFNLSDEEVCCRWTENILWQFFSGLDFYEHRLPCDPTQIGRFRRTLGEDGLEQLLKATIDTAAAIKGLWRCVFDSGRAHLGSQSRKMAPGSKLASRASAGSPHW